jgi:pimeloyl-ACP methyl ester carboxylesterase
MAKVVMVHGAFNELWGPHEIKAKWLPALNDGLWHHGVEVGADDVAVCFYGDLFRQDPEDADAAAAFAKGRAGVAELLQGLGGDLGLAALQQAAGDAVFDRTVDLVTTLQTRTDLRDQVRARLEAVVGPETKVLVAHSLGTVISYTALGKHPDWEIDTFVTLGSPLGQPMVFDSLDPKPEDGVGAWPGSVRRWVNVAAVGDKAAGEHSLCERFGDQVEHHRVDNGHRAHDPEPYLNAAVTGAAVAAALDG